MASQKQDEIIEATIIDAEMGLTEYDQSEMKKDIQNMKKQIKDIEEKMTKQINDLDSLFVIGWGRFGVLLFYLSWLIGTTMLMLAKSKDEILIALTIIFIMMGWVFSCSMKHIKVRYE